MTIATVRRLAADIFNVGRNKVRISPDGLKEAEGALTRSDVRSLIEKGIITRAKKQGRASTGRTGRTGHGRRKGTPVDAKVIWMQKIRAQRRFLNLLLDSGALKKEARRSLYGKIKSGIFRNKKAMLLYLKDAELLPRDYEMPKQEFRKPEPRPQKAKAEKAGAKKGGKRAGAKKPEPAPARAEKAEDTGKAKVHEGHAPKHAEHASNEKGERR
jgi:large subunit ribosomal protein L19e